MKPIEELLAGKGYNMSWIDELAADLRKFIEAHPLNDFTIFTIMDVLEDICSEEAERHRVSLRLTAEERKANQEDAHMGLVCAPLQ
jgi:hypothetical protein